jgi:5-methylcytosine-specific restriction endonuclease McrA
MRRPAKDVKIDSRGQISLPKRARGKCRWCAKVIKAKRRRNWCSQECVDSFYESGTRGVKAQVRKRDRGICHICKIDTIALKKGVPKEEPARSEYLTHYRIPAARVKTRFSDIHHLKPASEGGKMTLANLRTVCLPCHQKETQEWALRKRAVRKESLGG